MSNQGSRLGAFAPLLVFGVLLTFVIALGAGILLTRPSGEGAEPARPAASPTASATDHQLTDAEAIARFKELDALRVEAIEGRDRDLVSAAFVSNSPAERRVLKTIRKLRRDSVRMKATRYDVLRVDVLSNEPRDIRIRQIVVIETRFFDKSGRDVTSTGAVERQTLEWVIQPQAGRWLLYEGTITAARRLSE
ncbi:MAG: hypothetical protein M3N53_01440 [Actinomycetota bacterium]|nr:hypothetical protein [Actinomycetota bacterium]